MFRTTILPIVRSIRLYTTVCGMLYPIRMPVGDLMTEFLRHQITDRQSCWVQHTTSCSVQSNAPEDGQNCCTKHVELIWVYQQTVIVVTSWLYSLPIMKATGKSTRHHVLHESSLANTAWRVSKLAKQ